MATEYIRNTADINRMNRSATAAHHRINKPQWSHAVILVVIRLRIQFNWLRFHAARLDHAAVLENEGK